MQHSPPPLFKQGASARVKVVFFTTFSIALLLVDSRMNSLVNARQFLATVLYPFQLMAVVPRDAMHYVSDYFSSTNTLQTELDRLKLEQIRNSEALGKNTFLIAENAQLRKLFDMKQRSSTPSVLAEVIYDVHNISNRKIFLNRGSQHQVKVGQPVIDDRGVVGQVTRVFPLASEVTLLTDKGHAIPVQVARSGLRAVLHGKGKLSHLEMSMTTNSDVVIGDELVTSGLDGIYPEGLKVAKVIKVESKASTTFENILCEPLAGIDQHQQLLILLVDTTNIGMPETEEVRTAKEKINRRVTRDSSLDESSDKQSEENKLKKEDKKLPQEEVLLANPESENRNKKIEEPKPIIEFKKNNGAEKKGSDKL